MPIEKRPIEIKEERGERGPITPSEVRQILLDTFENPPHREVVETLFPEDEGPGGWGRWRGEIGGETPGEEGGLVAKQREVIREVAEEFRKILEKRGWYPDWFKTRPPNIDVSEYIHKVFISKYAAIKYAEMVRK